MRKIQIEVAGDVAYCHELGTTVVGDDAEDSVRRLLALLKRELPADTIFLLPYMGQDFVMRWHDVRLRVPKPEDEFEDVQKLYEGLKEEQEMPW